jgi:hypothetical protein
MIECESDMKRLFWKQAIKEARRIVGIIKSSRNF